MRGGRSSGEAKGDMRQEMADITDISEYPRRLDTYVSWAWQDGLTSEWKEQVLTLAAMMRLMMQARWQWSTHSFSEG